MDILVLVRQIFLLTFQANINTVFTPLFLLCISKIYIYLSSVHDSDKKLEKKFIASAYQVRAAVATAIGVAAARAKMLADQEEREMELLMASIIETQVKIFMSFPA